MRWARIGRLRALALERGRLAAWESEIREAVEAHPYEYERAERSDVEARGLRALHDLEEVPAEGGRRG